MDRFTRTYLKEVKYLATKLLKKGDSCCIDRIIDCLIDVRENGGRLFIIGVGGSAANASHAVNDFRKLTWIEAYTPTDNVSELTARINDSGWENSLVDWLRASKLTSRDMVFVFSVGGGDEKHNISVNIIRALDFAKERDAAICGIIGKKDGYTAKIADACVIIEAETIDRITPHTESFQSIIWHLLVSHPRLKMSEMKWESLK